MNTSKPLAFVAAFVSFMIAASVALAQNATPATPPQAMGQPATSRSLAFMMIPRS
jgi:hypothetical protein